jgi:hypothetical protein
VSSNDWGHYKRQVRLVILSSVEATNKIPILERREADDVEAEGAQEQESSCWSA